AAHGCPSCHQSANPGDGVLSGQTTPRPGTHAYGRNLTPDPDTGLGRWTDDAIVRAIRAGIDDEGEPLCDPMPVFGDLSEGDGRAIVAYLRSLPAVRREIPETECGIVALPGGDDGSDAAAPEDASAAEGGDSAGAGALDATNGGATGET